MVVSWWFWLIVKIFLSGSSSVAIELQEKSHIAVFSTVEAFSTGYLAIVKTTTALFHLAEIFAPFLVDAIDFFYYTFFPRIQILFIFLFPFVTHVVNFTTPLILSVFDFIWDRFCWVPLEIQISAYFVPTCLIAAQFDRRAFHLLVLPVSWVAWILSLNIFPASRLPLQVAAIIVPLSLSMFQLYEQQKADHRHLLSLNAYWTLFPALSLLDSLVQSSAPLYVSTATVLIVWFLATRKTMYVLDFLASLSWNVFGEQALFLASKASETASLLFKDKWSQFAVLNTTFGFLSKLKEMGLTYKVLTGILTLTALLYWAFAVMEKILGFLVWPWYLFEMSKVCLNRTEAYYRQHLAFALLLLGLEYLILPRSPSIIYAVLSLFHLPIVFLLKMSSEILFDSVFQVGGKLIYFTNNQRKFMTVRAKRNTELAKKND